jgi:hypothetical protein
VLDEFLVRLDVFPDHLEVHIRGVGKLNVALHEVGLRKPPVENGGVGGPSGTPTSAPSASPILRSVCELVIVWECHTPWSYWDA